MKNLIKMMICTIVLLSFSNCGDEYGEETKEMDEIIAPPQVDLLSAYESTYDVRNDGSADFGITVENADEDVLVVVHTLDLLNDPDQTAAILRENSCNWENIDIVKPVVGEAYLVFRGKGHAVCDFVMSISACPEYDYECHDDDGVGWIVFTHVIDEKNIMQLYNGEYVNARYRFGGQFTFGSHGAIAKRTRFT